MGKRHGKIQAKDLTIKGDVDSSVRASMSYNQIPMEFVASFDQVIPPVLKIEGSLGSLEFIQPFLPDVKGSALCHFDKSSKTKKILFRSCK